MARPSLYSPPLITFNPSGASFAYDGEGMPPCRYYPTGPSDGDMVHYRLDGATNQHTLKSVHVLFSPTPDQGDTHRRATIAIDLSDDVLDALLHLRGLRAVPL